MTGAVDAPAATLAALFDAHRDRPWIFVRPGGNWGDHLIYVGAERLARACGLNFVSRDTATLPAEQTSPEHCIYLHGGGGYNSWGTGRPFRNLAEAAARDARLVVQGPQTVEAASTAIRERIAAALRTRRCGEAVFFARERYSLTALQAMALEGVDLALDHDTAFHLTARDILELAAIDTLPRGRYELTAYREDDEKPALFGGTPARGIVLDPAYVAGSFQHWLRIHLFATRLLTNRLHSCIVAALVGKPVTLAFGSYHKNRSIWDYSLASRGVDWTEGIRVGRTLWSRLPRRVRESYKLGRMRLMLRRVPAR